MKYDMLEITPGKIETRELHQFLLGSVAPRPIAFVSTLGSNGVANLAPYSFFNAFSSNPPILVFSSNRRVVNNTTKDTLANVMESKEAVINVVSHDIIRQMTVASVEFPTEESEFTKTGLTEIPSVLVKAPRVAESPVQMECKVKEIIALGVHGGAGHLIICEVVKMHIRKSVIDENNRIDPHKIDLMGRMGRSYYVRASGKAVQTIFQPVTKMVIGFDQLPKHVQKSKVLTGNDLGLLAGCFDFPDQNTIRETKEKHNIHEVTDLTAVHSLAKRLIENGKREEALAILTT